MITNFVISGEKIIDGSKIITDTRENWEAVNPTISENTIAVITEPGEFDNKPYTNVSLKIGEGGSFKETDYVANLRAGDGYASICQADPINENSENSAGKSKRNVATGESSLALGKYNRNHGKNCYIIGYDCTIDDQNEQLNNDVKYNFISGEGNQIISKVQTSAIFGTGNKIMNVSGAGGIFIAGKKNVGTCDNTTIFGQNNTVLTACYSLINGNNNRITYTGEELEESVRPTPGKFPDFTNSSFITGTSNIIKDRCANSIITGTNNTITNIQNSIVAGVQNTDLSNIRSSLIVGSGHTTNATDASNNKIDVNSCGLIGANCLAERNYQLICGYNNQGDNTALFIVGAGNSDKSRKNAFAIYPDGNLFISDGTLENTITLTPADFAKLKKMLDNYETGQGVE